MLLSILAFFRGGGRVLGFEVEVLLGQTVVLELAARWSMAWVAGRERSPEASSGN